MCVIVSARSQNEDEDPAVADTEVLLITLNVKSIAIPQWRDGVKDGRHIPLITLISKFKGKKENSGNMKFSSKRCQRRLSRQRGRHRI
ncbi:unnamed protein product [Sphagnum balticum]